MAKSPLTAAILIIGNEILSGKTLDINTQWIAQKLAARGIRLRETRTIADVEGDIVTAVNLLREKYTYVFTTGGIGPTHDDITGACISKAFSLPHEVHQPSYDIFNDYLKAKGSEMNDARKRMVTLPRGATPIYNPHNPAPGFNIGNVFVLAGIPAVMQAMWVQVETMIAQDAPVVSQTVTCNKREGDIAAGLEAIQKRYADLDIGSYPASGDKGYTLALQISGIDAAAVNAARAEVEKLVA